MAYDSDTMGTDVVSMDMVITEWSSVAMHVIRAETQWTVIVIHCTTIVQME